MGKSHRAPIPNQLGKEAILVVALKYCYISELPTISTNQMSRFRLLFHLLSQVAVLLHCVAAVPGSPRQKGDDLGSVRVLQRRTLCEWRLGRAWWQSQRTVRASTPCGCFHDVLCE